MSNYMNKYLPVLIFFLLLLMSCQGKRQRIVIECGGGAKFACPKGMFCDLGEQCGGFDGKGQCRRVPGSCPEQKTKENSVCTCDDQTYSSHCYAHASGRSIAYKGECIHKKSRKKSRKRKYEFIDTSDEVDASGVEGAGDIIHDQFSPAGRTR